MKHRLATMSETRVWARQIIDQVIADHVFGPVGCLPPADVLELRKILRQQCPLGGLSSWQTKILREEFRAALGYVPKRRPKMIRCIGIAERDVLPSMREWARKVGLIRDPEPASQP